MLPITKDCEVEVSYEKNGFKGVWYKAILEESPTKSRSKLLRVCYTTSLEEEEDGQPPLTEIVDQSLIRPVPPKDMNDSAVFEEGSVVNADCIYSWWTGMVVKRKENDKYLVYFDSPPKIIEFERNQLRVHLDWTGSKWVRLENKEVSKSVFSTGTMVELRRPLAWHPAMIIKEVENGKSFTVKVCCGKPEITVVDSRIVRPKQPFSYVGEYELLDHVEVFDGSVWCDGVVRGIVYEGRYMVSFGKAKVASAQFNHSDLRPPMMWEDGIWHKRPKTKSKKETPSDVIYYSRKRKRGVYHNSDLNNAVLSSDQTFTVVKKSAANVEDTQAKDTPIVLPFAKKSPFWKSYEAMEVFRKVPQSPHFSPLIESTSEDFREGSALGMMASFSLLLEKLKDLETDVTVSQLDSLKDSFTKLENYGFDVTRPLSRIKKLLALKDRQLNILEKRKGLDKERLNESSKRRKAELEIGETERKMLEVKQKILELQRQEAALKELKKAAEEQKDEAYRNIFQMESCTRDLCVELEDVEFDFETILSAPW